MSDSEHEYKNHDKKALLAFFICVIVCGLVGVVAVSIVSGELLDIQSFFAFTATFGVCGLLIAVPVAIKVLESGYASFTYHLVTAVIALYLLLLIFFVYKELDFTLGQYFFSGIKLLIVFFPIAFINWLLCDFMGTYVSKNRADQ